MHGWLICLIFWLSNCFLLCFCVCDLHIIFVCWWFRLQHSAVCDSLFFFFVIIFTKAEPYYLFSYYCLFFLLLSFFLWNTVLGPGNHYPFLRKILTIRNVCLEEWMSLPQKHCFFLLGNKVFLSLWKDLYTRKTSSLSHGNTVFVSETLSLSQGKLFLS